MADYLADLALQSAVERQFTIIGEALSRAIKQDPSIAQLVSDTPRIIAFRNRLVHGYDDISGEFVWGVIQKDLLRLYDEVGGLLRQYTEPPGAES